MSWASLPAISEVGHRSTAPRDDDDEATETFSRPRTSRWSAFRNVPPSHCGGGAVCWSAKRFQKDLARLARPVVRNHHRTPILTIVSFSSSWPSLCAPPKAWPGYRFYPSQQPATKGTNPLTIHLTTRKVQVYPLMVAAVGQPMLPIKPQYGKR